ncbi:hypothetical protein GZH53_15625 [Flavihumibacter sp. R14]|nr:hypothetical protein [Flavihumibacter soli]
MKHEILIETADEGTGNLGLTIGAVNADVVEVKRLHRVTWSIATDKVYSFRIEQKKDSEQIFFFFSKPSSKHTDDGTKAWVSVTAKKGADYNYSIWWRGQKDGKEFEYDPKISVKP